MTLPTVPHYVAVLVLTVVAITGNSECVLPDQSTIRTLLQTLLASIGGEGVVLVQNISEYRFTCMAVGDSINRFRYLSIAIRYNVLNPDQMTSQVSQIQLVCSGEKFSPFDFDPIEMNPPENVFNSSRRDCFICAANGPGVDTDANCIRKSQCMRMQVVMYYMYYAFQF